MSAQHSEVQKLEPPETSGVRVSDEALRERVAELEAQVVQQEAKIASILEITNALRATRSEDELLELIMEKISLLMGADRSTLFLLDEQSNELWTMITEGRRSFEVRLGVGEGIAGWVAHAQVTRASSAGVEMVCTISKSTRSSQMVIISGRVMARPASMLSRTFSRSEFAQKET